MLPVRGIYFRNILIFLSNMLIAFHPFMQYDNNQNMSQQIFEKSK